MRIHHGVDEQLFGVAAHSPSKGPRPGAKELLSTWGLTPPHTVDLGKTSSTSSARSASSSLSADSNTFESSQPWLGYW